MNIGGSIVDENSDVFFIADIGANHDGDIDRAKDLIKLAAESGANAVKFQHFKAETIVSSKGFNDIRNFLPKHQRKWEKSVFETYQQASINTNWNKELAKCCTENQVTFMTSPYDLDLAREIDPLVDTYKIGSGDISWMEIIDHLAGTGKNLIVATGASDINDVRRAYKRIKKYGNKLCLMQCNTNYTGDHENNNYLNLKVLNQYRNEFPDVLLGLSDHTFGHISVIGAVALGAMIIEKHFTDDNQRLGPDHKFAMNPKTWREMVDATKQLKNSLGDGRKKVEDNEKLTYIAQRRSIYTKLNLPKGHILKKSDIIPLRPNQEDSFPVHNFSKIIGKRLTRNLDLGECIKNTDIEL